MKNANPINNIHCASTILILLCGAAVACGSASNFGDDSANTKTPPSNFVAVTESVDDPGYCGYYRLGVDDQGNDVIEEERYFYPRINEILNQNPDLQQSTGLSSVADCASARVFMTAYDNYQDYQASPASDKQALMANVEVFPSEGVKSPAATSDGVTKMMVGTDVIWPEVVAWGWTASKGANKGKSQQCTAIRLSGTLFLTAAHCMATMDRAAGSKFIDTFPISRIKHQPAGSSDYRGLYYDSTFCTTLAPNTKCILQEVEGYMNPNYAGSGDYRNDLALIYVLHDYQGPIRSAPSATSDFGTWVAWISTVTPVVGESVSMIGWGPDGAFDSPDPADWFMQKSGTVPINSVDSAPSSVANGLYNGTSLNTVSTNGAQLCRGDSGGGVYDNQYLLRAILDKVQLPYSSTDPNCAAIGKLQYAARLDYFIFDFIPIAVTKLQGADAPACHCAFFPGPNDPTGINPESPGAHMRCNVGCEEPTNWSAPN